MGAAAAKTFPASQMLPAAGPLEDDNLLSEILLRLPPLPSTLPRASDVCKRWHSLVTDCGFVRRFCLRHRRNPPLPGYFLAYPRSIRFEPTMEATNRVPPGRFSFLIDDGDDGFMFLGCRHGLVLILHYSRDQVLVWDPVKGDQHRVATPPGFGMSNIKIVGTVLRTSEDDHDDHFQVVLVGYDARTVLFIYSSGTRLWSTPISAPSPYDILEFEEFPPVLVGNSLYWLSSGVILEVDLCRQSIAVNPVPMDTFATVVRAEGSGVGLLSLQDYTCPIMEEEYIL